MAAPQRQIRPILRPEKRRLKKVPLRPARPNRPAQRRKFVVLVLVPVLFMLGSVYLHMVAANLGEEVSVLEQKHAGLLVEKERLEVEMSELSAPGRIRPLARKDLGMRSPGAKDMRVYERGNEKQDDGRPLQESAR